MLNPLSNIRSILIALTMLAVALHQDVLAQSTTLSDRDGHVYPLKAMPDGNLWMTTNLRINIPGSYDFAGSAIKNDRYGRLYTWPAAMEGCRQVGNGWRLPSFDEWRAMVKHYGGIRGDGQDSGRAAFKALIDSGSAGFNIVYSGSYDTTARTYHRVDAHGFYWTATESDSANAWFLNLGRNGQFVNRHPDGEKHWAIAVRCVKTATKSP
ncbi:FISUMP domain-containing protein [Paraflavitalea sp. CAU 1676]|uniref:FISUMP domain-containing protein n=1 Tax=Paraflavitalea sp. CAU 1676 TaxID=3032598 RepID=UPI0023DA28B4|nr:FISUMP domain-containing protein [Paraflavitalea sp. CAU 1676]MDF2192874.1 FISUMP domain-containing protein [Paraflavitalea sp. CAU 1676]